MRGKRSRSTFNELHAGYAFIARAKIAKGTLKGGSLHKTMDYDTIRVDDIEEETTGTGTTFKHKLISAADDIQTNVLNERTSGSGITAEETLLKAGDVSLKDGGTLAADNLAEKSVGVGITTGNMLHATGGVTTATLDGEGGNPIVANNTIRAPTLETTTVSDIGGTGTTFQGPATFQSSVVAETNLAVGTASAASTTHVYEDTDNKDTSAGFTVEQAGTGHAALQFLKTGGERYVMGIDANDANAFKISNGNLANDYMRLDKDGTSRFRGFTVINPITTLYNPYQHLAFDINGNLGKDLSTNANNATIDGSPVQATDVVDGAGKKKPYVIRFTQSESQRVDLDAYVGAYNSKHSYCFWFKCSPQSSTGTLWAVNNSTLTYRVCKVSIRTDGKVYWELDTPNWPINDTAFGTYDDNKWHFIVVTMGNGANLYIDNVWRIGEGNNNNDLSDFGTSYASLGMYRKDGFVSNLYVGDMADYMVYGHRLNSSERTALYNLEYSQTLAFKRNTEGLKFDLDSGHMIFQNNDTQTDIVDRLGDNAGATAVEVQDSDKTSVFRVDSNGDVTNANTLALGSELKVGSANEFVASVAGADTTLSNSSGTLILQNTDATKHIRQTLGDAAGVTYSEVVDSSGTNPLFRVYSDGTFRFYINNGTSANEVQFRDSADTKVASVSKDGDYRGRVVTGTSGVTASNNTGTESVSLQQLSGPTRGQVQANDGDLYLRAAATAGDVHLIPLNTSKGVYVDLSNNTGSGVKFEVTNTDGAQFTIDSSGNVDVKQNQLQLDGGTAALQHTGLESSWSNTTGNSKVSLSSADGSTSYLITDSGSAAVLDVKSDGDVDFAKDAGIRLPRRSGTSGATAETGRLLVDTSEGNVLKYYNGTSWKTLAYTA